MAKCYLSLEYLKVTEAMAKCNLSLNNSQKIFWSDWTIEIAIEIITYANSYYHLSQIKRHLVQTVAEKHLNFV